MSSEIKTLKNLKVFDDMPEKELVSLINIVTQRRLKQDELLLKEGTPINSMFVVMNGSLRIEKHSKDAHYTVSQLHHGDVFGVMPNKKNYISSVSIVANEPTTVWVMNDKTISLLKPLTKEMLLFNIQSLQHMMHVASLDIIADEKHRVSLLQNIFIEEYTLRRQTTLNSTFLQEELKKIPSLPSYTYELAGLLTKQSVSSDKIVDYIKSDPSLMALVLKAVNSPMYSLSQKVTDFHHAVLLLGFSQIYQIVMDNSLNNVMPNRPEFIELRDRALMVSTIGFEVAMICGYDKPLIISTIGTLHILGEVIKELLKKETGFSETITLFDDAIIAYEVLRNWKMPETIYKPISYYRYPNLTTPSAIPEDVLKIVSILHVSIECYKFLNQSIKTPSAFISEYLKVLSISEGLEDIMIKRIIPNLKKRFDLLPKAVQFMLKEVKIA